MREIDRAHPNEPTVVMPPAQIMKELLTAVKLPPTVPAETLEGFMHNTAGKEFTGRLIGAELTLAGGDELPWGVYAKIIRAVTPVTPDQKVSNEAILYRRHLKEVQQGKRTR